MQRLRRPIDFSHSGPYFGALLLVTLIAFWPTYLSRIPGIDSAYCHLHALTASLWISMLVVQPQAIRTRRMDWHRTLGRASYVLAPLTIASMVLLAHSRLRELDGAALATQNYFLYLQLSLAALFALSYGMAVYTRRTTALHARFLVCTALTLIDPVIVRLMAWVNPAPTWNYQWVTFGLTDAVLAALIWTERRSPTGRAVFPAMLVLFIAAQTPALFGWTGAPAWENFCRWFMTLQLT